jgi:PPOX class probable F420-dependent enzyme
VSEVDAWLSVPSVAVLSTVNADGSPHSACVWFAPTDAGIDIVTPPDSVKARNLRRDPRCTVVVPRDTDGGHGYALLQGRATVTERTGEVERIAGRYLPTEAARDFAAMPHVRAEVLVSVAVESARLIRVG